MKQTVSIVMLVLHIEPINQYILRTDEYTYYKKSLTAENNQELMNILEHKIYDLVWNFQ